MTAFDVPAVLERLGIKVKRQGRELWACCPFHEERTPSWRIRNDPGREYHGVWQCFGACVERSGSLLELVRRLKNLKDRREARRWIEGNVAELEERPTPARVELEESRPEFVGGMRLPNGVEIAPLSSWPTPARRYLEGRGVTAEQVERWGIGFATRGRLAGRIVIPIRDAAGSLVSYTGRLFAGAGPRYREPGKDEGARKDVVFGELHWRDAREVVVAEGAFDALAVERVTGKAVAAVYGSELLPGHLVRLSRFERIVVASDADAAGDKLHAALRGAFARHGVEVTRACMAGGVDAAELALRSPERLARIIEAAA